MKDNHSKIAIIVPYFGKWPVWMDLYLYSCGMNPCVDILFFTDCPIPSKIYSNTHFFPISFIDYKRRVSEALSIDFNPGNGYKLCDLKPFLGVIHAKEVSDYDFWGFGDIDLIFGNLSFLFNDLNLSKYDIITTQSIHMVGPLTIVRKISKYTTACFKIKNWKKKLTNNKNLWLDECDWNTIVNPLGAFAHFLFYHIPSVKRRCTWLQEINFHQKLSDWFYFLNRKVLVKETYSTPPNSQICLYNIRTSAISYLSDWENANLFAGKAYFHFLFYKGDNGWREGFYKIPSDYNFGGSTDKIIIDNAGIRIRT